MPLSRVPGSVVAVIAVCRDDVVRARSTVRSLFCDPGLRCLVVDVDRCYRPVRDEGVVAFADAVAATGIAAEAVRAAATLAHEGFRTYATVVGAGLALANGASTVLLLTPGVVLQAPLAAVLAATRGPRVVAFADPDVTRARAAAAPVNMQPEDASGLVLVSPPRADPLVDPALFVVDSIEQASLLLDLVADWRTADRALDLFAEATDAAREPGLLAGGRRHPTPGTVDVAAPAGDGAIPALDLTRLDPHRPWILDPAAPTAPRLLLSEHPALVTIVAQEAAARVQDAAYLSEALEQPGVSFEMRSRGDASLRSEARRSDRASAPLPDLLSLGVGEDPRDWALALVPKGHPMPVARYLDAVRAARPDLVRAFPEVPGRDVKGLMRWARDSGMREASYDPELLAEAVAATTIFYKSATERPARASGVNVVGYLATESGLGESARQMEVALRSAGVATGTFDVGSDIGSRRGAAFRESGVVPRTATLLCVNGAETAMIAPRIASFTRGSRVIGMWYWETEQFPRGHLIGLKHVDEVWTASDFIRDAIAPHAGDLPVVTVTPPLPQAGDDPGIVPSRFGIPDDRPWFLFTFDFLSFAPRKNPVGLIEAFDRAFGSLAVEGRPMLVIKTINAARQPDDAEHLRLLIAGRPDVLLLEEYLDDHERHVLVSHCTAYVSLHKAEGLGLTVAEAMAWARPVITTGYGGVTQFCTPANSFLVDFERSTIPETIGPYIKGSPWAEPDLDHAAQLMRRVIEDPDYARDVGKRAARDIREQHNPQVAGDRMLEVLEEGEARWLERRRLERKARRTTRAASAPVLSGEAPSTNLSARRRPWRRAPRAGRS